MTLSEHLHDILKDELLNKAKRQTAELSAEMLEDYIDAEIARIARKLVQLRHFKIQVKI